MKRICMGVVLYNPNLKMLENIQSFIGDVSKIYIYDNSLNSHQDMFKKIKSSIQIEYMWNGQNDGLSHALNCICKKAFLDQYDYIFTMDQDSIFVSCSIKNMVEFANRIQTPIGIIAPKIQHYFNEKEIDLLKDQPLRKGYKKKKFAITSGSLINLNILDRLGYFEEKFFIEHIDTEYCIRMCNQGYKIIELENAILLQRAGNSQVKKILGKEVHPLYANPIRGYYLFRNHIFILRKYGKSVYQYTAPLYKTIIKTLLFEDHKFNRIYYYIKGALDGVKL